MAYIEDINKAFSENIAICKNCVELFNGKYMVVSGYKKIAEYNENELLFIMNRGVIRVNGENLVIVSVDKDEAYIKGHVKSVSLE